MSYLGGEGARKHAWREDDQKIQDTQRQTKDDH